MSGGLLRGSKVLAGGGKVVIGGKAARIEPSGTLTRHTVEPSDNRRTKNRKKNRAAKKSRTRNR